ncbi:LADA_0A04720g1_1 [Lachancea dasiensis]|uniref:LADA_0A04720g1_1 n=1 Tax=Lachancea dasiensis TaxID=1072105 RepID=A0A1G4INN5_9SACH|nr:LADA_0A04720g1_1 [Lachancea dasiensis]
MSLGISLSQLLVDNPKPFATGCEALDAALDGGFRPRAIYEVFGPPGVGTLELGVQLATNAVRADRPTLWMDAHLSTALDHLDALQHTKLDKFSHYVYFFQQLAGQERDDGDHRYALIVIRGLSKVVTDYVNVAEATHQFKNKSLITLFTAMTKYAHAHRTAIVLLNDAMNTGYDVAAGPPPSPSSAASSSSSSLAAHLVPYSDDMSSPFLLRSSARRRAVQVLRSALVANLAVGNNDQVWEVFLKRRVALLWAWDVSQPWTRIPTKHRIAVVHDLGHNTTTVPVPLDADAGADTSSTADAHTSSTTAAGPHSRKRSRPASDNLASQAVPCTPRLADLCAQQGLTPLPDNTT